MGNYETMVQYNTAVRVEAAGSIVVTITGEFGYVEGWSMAREDLGLNEAGPDPIEGVLLVDESPEYYDDGETIKCYSEVVLRFGGVDSLEAASDRLYNTATERFEWGMGCDAQKVQDFAGAIPTSYDIEQAQSPK